MGFNGAVLAGIVSRSPETIRVHRLLRDGYSTKEKFLDSIKKDEEKIISAQEKGFAFVSGGQLSWLDLLRPLASSFKGFEKKSSQGEDSIGPVTRWYSTNTFYRKPSITKKISSTGKELSEFLPEIRKGIVFLLGPYSFAKLTENAFYKNKKKLVLDYSKAIAENAVDLRKKGYKAILFSEPSFGFDSLKGKFDESLWVNEFAEPLKKKGIFVGVNFPSADASKAIPLVEGTSFDFIGIDAIHSDFSRIKTEKDVLLGVVDGSRIGIESPKQIKKIVGNFKEKAEFSGNYYIGTDDRLFDVPFEQGMQKIEVLSGVSGELKKNE